MRQMGNDMVRVDDLDVMRSLDVGCRDWAFTFLAQHQGHFFTVVETEHHTLQVEHDVDDVFLDAINGRILVKHTSDRHFGWGIADHRRQQYAAQSIAEGVAVTAFERLQRYLGAMTAERLHIDGLGFEQIGLHEVFLSIPSVRYTDKADTKMSRRPVQTQIALLT